MSTQDREFKPAYDFAAHEGYVTLHQGPAEVHIDGKTYPGDGIARLDLLPRPGIYLSGKFRNVPLADALMAMSGQKAISDFYINGRRIEGFLVSFPGGVNVSEGTTSQEMNVKWRPKSEPIIGVGDESTRMVRIIFHLFNFVDFVGARRSTEQSDHSIYAIGHVDLNLDGWNAELKSMIATREQFEVLKAEGGYRITHIGHLEREDGSSFSGREAGERLILLRYFLSFAKGAWCNPVCAVGLDASGKHVWGSWSSPADGWHSPLTWFDPHTASQLTTLFPGFVDRWENDDW